jgi:5-methylcytosine-specific restriction endonuclease McrA
MQSRVKNILNEEPYRKQKIPVALREQVWIRLMGHKFDGKCRVKWCRNRISVFDFQCGHNVPESRGGKTDIDNLIPICARCNNSMGNSYTIDEWNVKFAATSVTWWKRYFTCVGWRG